MREHPPGQRRWIGAALLLFTTSGALGLAYQVVWSRYLLDSIGASAHSHATVLAAFMGGLAIGNALLGPLADRVRRPLLLFAGLEGLVALYGLAYHRLHAWVAAAHLASDLELETASRIAAAAALILPPTILMGGTYPAVLRHITAGLLETGRRASQSYAANALGAAGGSLVTAFVLLPALGLRTSLLAVASVNLAVAGLAAVIALRSPEPPRPGAPAPDGGSTGAEPGQGRPSSGPGRAFWFAALFAAGFLAFSLEIAWTRFLGLAIGSSSDGFALMLAAFIAGIGLGSAVLARYEHRLRDPLAAWGLTQLATACALLVLLPLLQYLPWVLLRVQAWFAPSLGGWAVFTLARLTLCLAVMLPVTVALGVSLPLVVKGITASLRGLAALAGRCYAWNTAGNVIGAALSGLFLLPALGVEGLFRFAALGTGLLGFGVLFARLPPDPAARRRRLGAAAGVVVALMATQVASSRWNPGWFVFSPFRPRAANASFAEARGYANAVEVLMFADDAAANILVFDHPPDERDERSLFVNGKAEASVVDDGGTQALIAHIPLVLRPRARSVLVIGLASGDTAGAVLRHPVERLDVVELVPTMPVASRHFDEWNGRPLDDARTRLLLRDARTHLARPGPSYDLIVSEPSNPWMSGAAALFAAEFYAAAAKRLGEGGLFAQWLQLYELDDASFLSALASFHASFPRVAVFQTLGGDALLLGAREPWEPDWEASLARAGDPEVSRQLREHRVSDLASLLALQRLSPAGVEVLLSGDPRPHTDDNRLLEYRAPRSLFMGRVVEVVERFDERRVAAPTLLLNRFAAAHPEEIRAEPLLRLASGTWLRETPLHEAWAALLLDRRPGAADDPAMAPLLPRRMLASPPPRASELRQRLESLTATTPGAAVAERVAATWAPAILQQVALDAEEARLWVESTSRWGTVSGSLRRLRIEILAAAGALGEARSALAGWLDEPFPPPRDWALHTACLIDEDGLCRLVREPLGLSR